MVTFKYIRSSLFVFLWIITISSCFSQKVWVSPDIRIKNDFTFDLLAPWPSGNTLLFRDKLYTYEVEAYDDQLNFLWSKSLDLEDRKVSIVGIVDVDTSFTIIYSFRKNNQTIIKTKSYTENVKLIKEKVIFKSKDDIPKTAFRFTTSEDRKRVLIFYTRYATILNLLMYDLDNLSRNSPIKIEMKSRNWKEQLEGITISNSGVVFIVRDVSFTRENKGKLSILLHVVYEYGGVITKNIKPGDYYANDLHFAFDNTNEKLVLAGVFNTRNSDRNVGYWMFGIDKELRPSGFAELWFNEEALHEVNGKTKNNTKGIKDLYITELLLRQDGGVVIVGEVQKEYSRRPDLDPRLDHSLIGTRRWVDYYYEDILVMSVHPNGTFHWSSVLHKRQYSQDDEALYSSFFIVKNPALLRIIFNDEIKNSNTISEYIVTSRGLLERNSLFNTANLKLQLRIQDAIQVGAGTILIPSQSNNLLNIVKMVF